MQLITKGIFVNKGRLHGDPLLNRSDKASN